MKIYLVQHGEAKSEADDPERPLTDRGRREVATMAAVLKRNRLPVAAIWHSGKLRASQTAGVLALALEPEGGVTERSGLAPKDDPAMVAAALERPATPIMVVGHLPHLSRLASLLTVGDPEKEIIRFRPGGVLCLLQAEEGWRVAWYLTPELAGSDAG